MATTSGFARRATAGLLFIWLLSAACGARLTDQRRAAAIAGSQGGASSAAGGQSSTGEVSAGGTAVAEAGPSVEGGAPAARSSGPGPAVAKAGAARAVQPGNTASDVGVTPSEMTIASIADISGVQPGIFRSAHQGVQALVAYQNSVGPIHGRTLKALLLDDKTDSGGNRAAVLEACDKAFALVGSMSAFDDGGADAVDSCGIPDISTITTNGNRIKARNTFALNPNRPDYWKVGPWVYLKERFPQSIKKGALLWLNVAVARANAENLRRGVESQGYEFIYTAETQVLEANYAPYVLEMRRRGAEYVTLLADYQSIARMLKAMRQQSYEPPVRDFVATVYSPDFIELAGPASEGVFFYLDTAMFEDAATNPELQLYLKWLQQVAPGARPDEFGVYAWSAGRLFVKLASDIGPNLTRERFLTELRKVHAWDGYGVHTSGDVGNKLPSNCFVEGQVKDAKFVRIHPSRPAFACDKGPLVKTG
jgi:ABC-type branched-subunit amino acid transport system substrate-binding protein